MYNQLSKQVTVSFPLVRGQKGEWAFDLRQAEMDERGWTVARETMDALLEQSGDRFAASRELYLWVSGWMLRDGTGGRRCKVLAESLGVVTAEASLVTHTAQLCTVRLTDYR